MVEPVDPFGGGQFDFLDGAPGLAGLDQLGLVQPIDRLGQGVVVGAAARADQWLDAGFGEAFSEPDRGVLRSSISMVDNIFQIEDAVLLTGPDGVLDRVEHY